MQLQEFRQDLDARMSAAKISGFWKQPDKDRWINKGIVRACNYARWKFLSKHATQLVEKTLTKLSKRITFYRLISNLVD